MRRSKKVFIIFFIILGFIFNVKALDGNISFSCDNTNLSTNATTTCYVKYDVTSGSLKGMEADISATGVNVESVSKDSQLDGEVTKSKINVTSSIGLDGLVNIATINITVTANSGSASITLNSISVEDESGVSHSVDNQSVPITIVASDGGITSLTADGHDILSSRSYTTSNDSVVIAVTKSSNVSVSGDGTKTLSCGENNFSLTVQNGTNSPTSYDYVITRTCSSDATLKSITVGNKSVTLSNGVFDYIVDVDASVDNVMISADSNNNKAILSGDANRNFILSYGSNIFTIMVSAEDGTKQEYKLTVNRLDNRDEDNSLENLEIEGVELNFDKDITNYNVSVESDVEEIEIIAIAKSTKATVSGDTGKKKLKVGSNRFSIIVTAENGITNDYTVIIVRKDASGELEDDCTLKKLTITGVDLKFDAKKTKYIINLEEMTDKLDITAVASSDKAIVTIRGNGNLKAGKNEIIIEVLSESGELKEYLLEVNLSSIEDEVGSLLPKEESKDDSSFNLLYIIIPLSLLIIVIIIVIIIRSKKKNTNDDDYSQDVGEDVNEETTQDIKSIENHEIKPIDFDALENLSKEDIPVQETVNKEVVNPIDVPREEVKIEDNNLNNQIVDEQEKVVENPQEVKIEENNIDNQTVDVQAPVTVETLQEEVKKEKKQLNIDE